MAAERRGRRERKQITSVRCSHTQLCVSALSFSPCVLLILPLFTTFSPIITSRCPSIAKVCTKGRPSHSVCLHVVIPSFSHRQIVVSHHIRTLRHINRRQRRRPPPPRAATRGRRSQSHDVRIRCTVVEEGTNIRGQHDEGGKISPSESLSAQRTFCSFVAALMLVGGVWARTDCKKNSLGMVRKVRLDLEILGLRYHTSVDMLRTFTFQRHLHALQREGGRRNGKKKINYDGCNIREKTHFEEENC